MSFLKKQLDKLQEKYVAHQAGGDVITAGVIGIVIIILILIFSVVQGALPTPTHAALAGASNNATATFASAMELAPVIIIVLIAAVVLFVVNRFRQ